MYAQFKGKPVASEANVGEDPTARNTVIVAPGSDGGVQLRMTQGEVPGAQLVGKGDGAAPHVETGGVTRAAGERLER